MDQWAVHFSIFLVVTVATEFLPLRFWRVPPNFRENAIGCSQVMKEPPLLQKQLSKAEKAANLHECLGCIFYH